jgi:alpha-tubulin suppressor-like RCC1 family protein
MRLRRASTVLVLGLASSVTAVVSHTTVAFADVGVISVTGGAETTCAVTADGAAKCWGWNADGQLGDGTYVDRLVPTEVVGLGADVAAVSDGCVLTTSGAVKCWGNDLGNGSSEPSPVPVDVSGLSSGVVATAGRCALTEDGAVLCWGRNTFGQVGNGSTSYASTPKPVSGLSSGVVAISAGVGINCAVTSGGAMKCWGYNGDGRLGDGTTTDRHIPVDVVGLGAGVTAISAGQTTCAVVNGALKCWGRNDDGQVGDGTTTYRHSPVAVVGLGSGVAQVSTNGQHSCAVTVEGVAKCWGLNYSGQLGNATRTESHVPVDVIGLSAPVTVVEAAHSHSCAITADATLHCWGSNLVGELGNGTASKHLLPGPALGLEAPPVAIATGYHHTCSVSPSGGAACWGDNTSGQLGDGTALQRNLPVDVVGLGSGVTALTAGYDHTCALVTGGAVKCWGNNAEGQLGDGTRTDRLTPVGVAGLSSGVVAISAGVLHTCALTSSAGVKCWGDNHEGQVGDGTTTDRLTPVDVSGLTSGVASVDTGGSHTCAVTNAGGAKCWGSGEALGNGSTSGSTVPVGVSSLASGVSTISAGNSHSCAITTSTALKCWGSGWPGNGTSDFAITPVNVAGFSSGADTVESSASSTCVLATGVVKCWGDNDHGQLGDGTTGHSGTPVTVSGLGTDIIAISANGGHACVITAAGAVTCWGDNDNGELGDGTAGNSTAPVAVSGFGLGDAEPSDAPVDVSVVPQEVAVDASWSPPVDDGGSAVTDYAVTAIDASTGVESNVAGSSVRTTSGATALDFSGLTNGRSYRLDVAPVTSSGLGASVVSRIFSPRPRVSIGSASVAEGSSEGRSLRFSVSLSEPSLRDVKVDYATITGTADAPTDFSAVEGTATIPAGQRSAYIRVHIRGDVQSEGNETFWVALSSARNAAIGRWLAAGGIRNDDPPVPIRRVAIGDAAVEEGRSGSRSVRMTITLSSPFSSQVTAHYATRVGTAGTDDFVAKSGTCTIRAGATSAVVDITIKPDRVAEGNESFTVSLTAPSGALLGQATGVATVLDDD